MRASRARRRRRDATPWACAARWSSSKWRCPSCCSSARCSSHAACGTSSRWIRGSRWTALVTAGIDFRRLNLPPERRDAIQAGASRSHAGLPGVQSRRDDADRSDQRRRVGQQRVAGRRPDRGSSARRSIGSEAASSRRWVCRWWRGEISAPPIRRSPWRWPSSTRPSRRAIAGQGATVIGTALHARKRRRQPAKTFEIVGRGQELEVRLPEGARRSGGIPRRHAGYRRRVPAGRDPIVVAAGGDNRGG